MEQDKRIVNGVLQEKEPYGTTVNEVLAQNANSVISEGGAGAKSITRVVKKSQDVVGYELSDGQRVSVEQAVEMAKQNQLNHVGVSVSKMGEEYIRSLPDGDESNNLSNLPVVTE